MPGFEGVLVLKEIQETIARIDAFTQFAKSLMMKLS